MVQENKVVVDLTKPGINLNLQPRSVVRYKGSFQKLMSERKYKVDVAVEPGWFHRNVPCRVACPVGTDARAYVRAIAEGDDREAYLYARENNPFVSVCGKICHAPCEPACTRGKLDEPVSIRALKGFAVERNRLNTREVYHWLNKRKRNVKLPERAKVPKIAIVGAGPAGLSAAHDLTLMGYNVKLFEASSQPGGMLMNAVPSFRLARELVQADIENILSLGMQLEVNTSCGKDFSLEELRERYDAVLLAVGRQKSQQLDVPGTDLKGVYQGLDFLREVVSKRKASIGNRVVVVGGGSLAVEVARTVRRMGGKGVKVTVVCYEAARGSRPGRAKQEMQAEEMELAEALQEGIVFQPGFGPRRFLGEQGKLGGVELASVAEINLGEEGQYRPVFESNGATVIEADTVFLAVGQKADVSFINGVKELAGEFGKLEGGAHLAATKSGIFTCGDLTGTGHVVEAVASGQKAALAIHRYLGGEGSLGLGEPRPVVPEHHHEKGDTFTRRMTISRMLPPVTPVNQRLKGMEPVEGGYSEKIARRQADRCLDCLISPVVGPYHPCNACGDCLDVCPTECLSLKFMNKKDLSVMDTSIEEAEGEGPWVGLIINEEECVHCGACAEACWADAIYMVRFKEM